ncbi:MAG TPA: PIN domain-containing protein [Micropepsaceae bacterium]|nr:PIN domain-containing protein [Micropepsaceae bacterium]
MILVDTSVWVEHFRRGAPELSRLLDAGQILCHPFVIGEVALGAMRQRLLLVGQLQSLPRCTVASDAEILEFINRSKLFERGIGYVDVHLLASLRITPGSSLWTFDKRLNRVAEELEIAIKTDGDI